MIDFGVSPPPSKKKQEGLDKKFEKHRVKKSDIEEKFTHIPNGNRSKVSQCKKLLDFNFKR